MFNIGIFSTHIPYIAFVVFYAYFLIFGTQKPAENDDQTVVRSAFITEVLADQNMADLNSQNDTYKCDFILTSDFETFIFKRKIKHRMNCTSFVHPDKFFTSLSNRPPPALG